MQVGDLSRTRAPREPHDNVALQALRVLLVVGLMSAGWIALWRFQGSESATEGMVAVAPPQTISVEPKDPAAPDRTDRVQVVDADSSAPIVLPRERTAVALRPEADEEDLDEAFAEPAIDTASIRLSHDQSLSVLKQFEAVVQQSPKSEPSKSEPSKSGPTKTEATKPSAEPRTDMNTTGTVTRQASAAATYVPAGGQASNLVDLNRGTVEQLNNLKGAGSLGRAIVRGRPYRSVEDLVTKRVVRRTVFERIKDQVVVQ